MQKIYFTLDDSGKIDEKNNYLFYGGFVFKSEQACQSFCSEYKRYLKEIKHKYPYQKEIKSNILKYKDRQKFIKQFSENYAYAVLIENDKLYDPIKKNAKSKGRFIDYALKRLIKEVLKDLLKRKYLKRDLPLEIKIMIDNQTIKSNGLYNLAMSIQKELTKGMKPHFEANYSPIFCDVKVEVLYEDSKKSLLIQGADILTGTVRKYILKEREIDFLNIFLKMP